MRGAWRRAALVLLGLALVAAAALGVARWRFREELNSARREVERGSLAPARQRLDGLARSPIRWDGGEVDYWIGVCDWASGQRDQALESFRNVPTDSAHGTEVRLFRAEDAVARGRLAEAEAHLFDASHSMHPIPKGTFRWQERLYRLEARFAEARTMLEWSFGEGAEADDLKILRELWVLDRGTVPLAAIRANLDHAGRLAPDDPGVALGRARLAILERRFDEAASWLRKCPDDALFVQAIARTELDLARATDRPHEALKALTRVDANLTLEDRLLWRAWLLGCVGDADKEAIALRQWLDIEPNEPRALERLADLTARAGRSAEAAALRRRKAAVDEALDRYGRRMADGGSFSTAAERLAMASLAESTGRRFEARGWIALALRRDPKLGGYRPLLARLDRSDAVNSRSAQGTRESEHPWDDIHLPTSASREPLNAPTARIAFADDAESAGLRFVYHNGETPIRQMPEPLGGGVAILDFDGDGWMDVFALQGGSFPPPGDAPAGDRLWRNIGRGRFEDVTASSGLVGRGYGHGVTVGDYDNDGDPDLFVTRWRSYALYRNNGDGTFTDVTSEAGLGGVRGWPTSAAFADLDGDGDLDLYVCHYLKWDPDDPHPCRNAQTSAYIYCHPRDFPAEPDHLFRNDGGRFVEVTDQARIIDRDGRGLGVVAADLDGDGKVDLFVANDTTSNYLFRNLGGMKFEEIGHAAGVAANAEGGYQASMGVACGDLDGDGLIDLAVTNFYGESTTFYRNLGGGSFADRTSAIGLAAASRYLLGFGIGFPDVDNDGRLDLLSANGHLNGLPNTPYRMPMQLLVGRADGTLKDVTASSGDALMKPRLGRGMALGDLDNDGRLDALVIDHNAPLAYLHNRTERPGHFLTLQLEGTTSNRDSVGSRVTIKVGGRRQVAQHFGGGSYESASDPRLHFGLGEAARVEEIEVLWPSGRVDHFRDLSADAAYRLREGDAEPRRLPDFPAP